MGEKKMTDSLKKVTEDFKEFVLKETGDSYHAGCLAIIDTFEEALDKVDLNCVPRMWLESARKEIERQKEKRK